jgi:transcriptional regulator with XRE-family HTH domain
MKQNPKYIAQRIAICEKIKQIMHENKITFEQLAQLSGFRQTNLCRMLTGRHSMSLDNFLRIIDALETSVPNAIIEINNLIIDIRNLNAN